MGRKKKAESEKIEKTSEAEVKDLEVAEADVTETPSKKRTSDRSVMLKELREKAKKLAEKIEGGIETEDLKGELAQKREMLITLDDYVKTGIHLGTKVITPDMKKFVYRRRADSIGVLNTGLIDEHLKKAISFIS